MIFIIKGEIRDAKCAVKKISFNNLDSLTDGKLISANLDFFLQCSPRTT